MRIGQDIAVRFPGLYLIHHNLPGKEVAPHSHPQHLLFLPLQGEIRVKLSGQTLKAGPGRLVYLPPGTEHAFESSATQGERLIALVDASAWDKAGAGSHPPLVSTTSQLAKELLFHLLLHPETRHASALVQTLCQAVGDAIEAGAHALGVEHFAGKPVDPRLSRALAYLEVHYAENVAMDQLARHAGLSPRSMNRLFRQDLGVTPKQAIAHYRIARAKELLASRRHSVTEVALDVGYNSLSQFITVFRQLTGQLPSDVARRG